MKSEENFDFYRHNFRISLSVYIFCLIFAPEALKTYPRFLNRSFSVYFSFDLASEAIKSYTRNESFRLAGSLRAPHERGGDQNIQTSAYSMGGRMRSSLKLPRGAKGCLNGNPVAYRTERYMPHHACSVLLLFMVK